jgi:hypothetical protein
MGIRAQKQVTKLVGDSSSQKLVQILPLRDAVYRDVVENVCAETEILPASFDGET